MPYARLIQMTHSIRRARAQEYQNDWLRSAFEGWQNYICTPVSGKHTPFTEWAEMMGVLPKKSKIITAQTMKAEGQRARANMDKIMEAFTSAREVKRA